jgi:hypothetical protein
MDFHPIPLHEYVQMHLKSNPRDNKAEVVAELKAALKAYHRGVRCQCGQAIGVIGSAAVGHAYFTCITGEADSSEDYEIAEACNKPVYPSARIPLGDMEDVPF